MNTTMKRLLLTFSLAALAGCAGAWNGEREALSIAQRHPIAVDSQVVTLTLPLDPDHPELSAMDKARLAAFADSYMTSGHGQLTITTPSGAGSGAVSEQRAAYIRKFLDDRGVSSDAVSNVSYRVGSNEGRDIILSYTHYVATPPDCGIWKGMQARDYANLVSPNFGCAAQHNLAAMIADPHDLIAPADSTPPDSNARVRMIGKYRAGQVTASDTDSKIQSDIAQ
ncbi:MAG: hypothetical protein GC153_13370 [Alphaproteobacteria bacterium]|nr:hypothetical protein [Alphaproteobacteria bacterium]